MIDNLSIMKSICILLITFLTFSVLAEAIGADGKAPAKPSRSTRLPHCVDDPAQIEAIKESIKLNSKNEHKYDAYKKALASDSDEELMARLVYAETKAANCSKINTDVATVVTHVISNRVKIKKGDVKAVVFERDQFASSLNIYSESGYKDFLCPNDPDLWDLALKRASWALTDKTKPTTTVNYFLYKHSPRWTKEPWKLEEDQSIASSNTRKCIKAFKNPKYK